MSQTYRYTIPASALPKLDPRASGRIQSFLETKGFKIDGVSIDNVAEMATPQGSVRVTGPFLRIESDKDPTEHLPHLPWDEPAKPDKVAVVDFLARVSRGEKPTHDAMIQVVAAMSRIVLENQT